MNYLSIFLLGFVVLPQQSFKWVSFNMIQRINTQGKTTRMDSRVFFQSNGNMVTQISSPTEIFIFNNSEGELRIYNPEENSVYKTVNYNYASLNNSFYYFLTQAPNMGLDKVGYKVSESKMDGDYLVTKWSPPAGLQADISGVELVSDGQKTVYMAFLDKKGVCFKKIFFYDFDQLKGITFPNSITEIGYVEDDSVITKTTFDFFEFNSPADKEILEMKIPDNAKLVK